MYTTRTLKLPVKLHYLLIIPVMMLMYGLTAQEVYSPRFVRKAYYADQTPPLREMKVILPGERVRDWKNSEIGNLSVREVPPAPENAATATYEFLQETAGTQASRGPRLNIPGVGNVNSVYPPDPSGAAGPEHYFQMINLSFAIWNKQGTKLYGPVDNSTLWEGFIGPWTGSNDGDPVVLYDASAGRWVASQFAIQRPNGKSYQLVAVSATGDPLGSYYRYAFEFDDFNDYPKMSTWHDGYYCTFNFFGTGLGFIGSGVAAFEREKMLAGHPEARMIFFGYFPNKFSLLPSDNDGPLAPAGTPAYIATMNAYGNRQFEIFEFKADWNNPANSTFQLAVTLDPGFFNPSLNGIPQPGTSVTLDALSQMLMFRLPYRYFGTYEAMVANHTVNVNGRAGIKWYEFRKEPGGNWYIYQQGVYAPNDGLHRWMGSIAMNAAGTIALGYTVSGSTGVYPSIRYTGRPANAPLGQMTYQEVEPVTGFGAQTILSRWGDYACLNVDPVNDSVFWLTHEYMYYSWKTRIISFDFGPIQFPQVNAGPDGFVCEDSWYYVSGTAQFAQSWLWTTSGDGFFVTPTSLTSPYLRGNGDLANGYVYLKLNAQGYGPGYTASDSLLLTIVYKPVVNAGNDATIHPSQTYLTNPQVSNFSSVLWSTSGDGTFADPSALQTIYTPGPGDISSGQVKLTLTAQAITPCSGSKSDQMILYFDPTVGISSPSGQKITRVFPNPSAGVVNVDLEGFTRPILLQVFDAQGQLLFAEKIQRPEQQVPMVRQIDFRYRPAGIYYVTILSGDQSESHRIVIR